MLGKTHLEFAHITFADNENNIVIKGHMFGVSALYVRVTDEDAVSILLGGGKELE